MPGEGYPDPTADQDPGSVAPPSRPVDPERGLRGAMSATLLLEGITLLLALPVASSADSLPLWALISLLLLTFAHIYTCTLIKKPWVLKLILGLQVAVLACWVIHPAIGIIGIIYGLVWWTLIYFRNEFRRRAADYAAIEAEAGSDQGPAESGNQ